MTKNDECWEELFNNHKILSEIKTNSFFNITSKQINELREARLMTKFDHKSNLPQLFEDNNLSILPITRGSYIIGDFVAYNELSYDKNFKTIGVSFPEGFESIDYNNLYSESAVLHCAYLCGMINDVLEEECYQTISGKMSTSSFDYKIKSNTSNKTLDISVNKSQCEIDGGFESQKKLLIIEAKNHISDDFLIRQIYYPYRLWKGKISKEIIPVYMTYSNNVFSFFIYQFESITEYNSLRLIEQKNFMISPEQITLDDINNILENVKCIDEPLKPFPQADNFERIMDLLSLLMINDLTSEEITTNYDFHKRQTDYYTNAAMYLGLIDKYNVSNIVTFQINEIGKKIMSQPFKQKNLSIVKKILEHEAFNKSLKLYFINASPITKDDIVEIMKNSKLDKVKEDSTFRRRAQTVHKWIEWILDLQNP